MPNDRVRILLSEGSSTNAREVITALGLSGHTVDLCDPNPACLGRFSRFVRRVHRCPVSGRDPIGYLRFVVDLLRREAYDVLFPANEQAYLFSWARELLAPLAGLAVADFGAFKRVQTKTALMRLLDELRLPHPDTRYTGSWPEIEDAVADLGTPCYVKTASGTASTGVWRIESQDAMASLRADLTALHRLGGDEEFVVQRQSGGCFEQSHGVFDQGRLVALCCTRRLAEGAQGGAALKRGVKRPAVERDYEIIGRRLDWHGSFSIDYFWDEETGRPTYIDANPRITEPMNAFFNGVNLAELQVRLSLGEHPASIPHDTRAALSHNLVQVMLGAAGERHSSLDVLRQTARAALRKGPYRHSREGMTPVVDDPPAVIALIAILGALLVDPATERRLTRGTIARYSLGDAVPLLARATPGSLGVQ